MREVVARTGVSAATLRAWESRHGFPDPARLPGGHRRYSMRDVEMVVQVAREREAGLPLRVAIERALRQVDDGSLSIFNGVRRRRPELTPYLLPKRTLVALSHAIEDECCAPAERALLFGSFQREHYYRKAERRWRELAERADVAMAFADFPKRRDPEHGPVEIPVDDAGPMGREWSVICEARDYSVFLAAWERADQRAVPDGQRLFETLWSVEPELVREAVRIAVELAAPSAEDVVEPLGKRLASPPPRNHDGFALVSTLTNRMVAYVGSARAGSG